MPGPDPSGSSAGRYVSCRMSPTPEGWGQLERSPGPIPAEAPDLPQGAAIGLYDSERAQFFSHDGDDFVSWSTTTKTWSTEHRRVILEAVLDLTPTLVQGIAKYIPGRAGIYVSAAGIVLQTGKGLYELSNQYLENRAGGVINKETLLASLGRITSAVANALGVALPKGGAAANTFNALGTAAATAATTADITNRFHQNREKAPREMYPGLHRNPPLGYRAGQFQPGAAPTTPPMTTSPIHDPSNAQPPATADGHAGARMAPPGQRRGSR